MNKLQLEQIAYAQGFAEERLKEAISMTEALVSIEPEVAALLDKLAKTQSALSILSKGYDNVRRENADFERKLMMVRGAIA